jgi:hypothetical protein
MATDVLRTGEDFDLHPSDGYADDRDEPRVAQQHVRDALNMFRGEWCLNGNYGIDWLGIKSRKLADPALLAAEIRRFVASIPSVRNVSISTVEREGRSVSVSLLSEFARRLQETRVYIALEPGGNVGYNGMAHVYFRARNR